MYRGYLLFILVLVACKNSHENSCKPVTQARGFGYSPRGYPVTDKHSIEFFEDVERFGKASITWKGSWRDDEADAGATPRGALMLADAAIEYCFVPVPVFEWRKQTTNDIRVSDSAINDWTNVAAREKFISMLVDYVTKYRPAYVFLGNENDLYYESNPNDYARWVIAYNAAFDAIKQVSETTLVGPVFNYEHLSGQGLFKAWNAQWWEALDEHDRDKIDVVGVTLHPFLNYVDPSDIPSNYLDQLTAKVGGRPIVITETGWPAKNLGNRNPQWVTTEEAQVDYVARLEKFTKGKNIPVVNWRYFNGIADDGNQSDEWKTFGSISILDADGIAYQVYSPWAKF